MGKLTNLNPSKALTEAEMPPTMATDAETDAKTAVAINAHLAATHPHPQYPLKTESQTFTPTIKSLCLSQGQLSVSENSIVNRCGLEVKGANGDSAAFMSFHRPNIIAAHFGIDENNYLAFGGWSFGGNSYKVWHGGFGIPVWQTPSDRRLKKNIKPIGSALEFIRQTKPIKFQYNSLLGKEHFGDKFQRERVHYGFLADDFPIKDLVAEREGEGYLGLDYIEIIPFLCRAVQEQQTQIQELQAQVSDLKNHLVTDLN